MIRVPGRLQDRELVCSCARAFQSRAYLIAATYDKAPSFGHDIELRERTRWIWDQSLENKRKILARTIRIGHSVCTPETSSGAHQI